MAYRAFPQHTYLTDIAVNAPIVDTVFHTPPSTGWSYLPYRALTWWGAAASCLLAVGGSRGLSPTRWPRWRALRQGSILWPLPTTAGPLWCGTAVTGRTRPVRGLMPNGPPSGTRRCGGPASSLPFSDITANYQFCWRPFTRRARASPFPVASRRSTTLSRPSIASTNLGPFPVGASVRPMTIIWGFSARGWSPPTAPAYQRVVLPLFSLHEGSGMVGVWLWRGDGA